MSHSISNNNNVTVSRYTNLGEFRDLDLLFVVRACEPFLCRCAGAHARSVWGVLLVPSSFLPRGFTFLPSVSYNYYNYYNYYY